MGFIFVFGFLMCLIAGGVRMPCMLSVVFSNIHVLEMIVECIPVT